MKKITLGILLDLVFLVVFNVLFFTLSGTEHELSAWISYGFIHFAYLIMVMTPFLTRRSSVEHIFGFTIYAISGAYFIIEFFVGILFVLINSESIRAALCVQVLIAGVYLAILLLTMIGNEDTADNLKEQEEEILFVRDASLRVKTLMGRIEDKTVAHTVEHVYDVIHASPVKQVLAAKTYEEEVMNKIDRLESAVRKGNEDEVLKVSDDILVLMENRNREIRLARYQG